MKRLLPMLLLVFSVGVEAETINYSGDVGDKKLWRDSSKTDQTQKTKPAA